jgi:hypothetical protein
LVVVPAAAALAVVAVVVVVVVVVVVFFLTRAGQKSTAPEDALAFSDTHVLVWLLLYAHRHRSILGAAGHIETTPANQLMEE